MVKTKILKGFTFIELLIVLSIIGLLATLALPNFNTAQSQARDTRRKNDLLQYSSLLKEFAGKNKGLYPRRAFASGVTAHTTLCVDLGFASSECPQDPKDNETSCSSNTCRYYYQSNNCGTTGGMGCAVDYVLWAALEDTDASTEYWVLCSNGKSGGAASSDIPPSSAGTCPL